MPRPFTWYHKFDLLLKNINIGNNFNTIRGRAFIFHMCFPYGLLYCSMIFDLGTLTLKFDLLLKNFNICNNFNTIRDRALLFHVGIAYDKTFHMVL